MTKISKLIFVLSLIVCSYKAQTETKPERLKEYLKKEKGKYGLWDPVNNKWEISPEYDKVSGFAFTDKPYDLDNHTFYKFQKGELFDLVISKDNKRDPYKKDHKIILKGITAFKLPFKIKSGMRTYDENYLFYLKDGRWGWAAGEISTLVDGHYQTNENLVTSPLSDKEPESLKPIVHEYVMKFYEDDPTLLIDSAGFKGLYTFTGKRVISPLYKSITDLGHFCVIINSEGLWGYLANNYLVSSCKYNRIEIKNFPVNNKSTEYAVCYLANGSYDLGDQKHILSKDEQLGVEGAPEREKEEANKKLAEKKASYKSKISWLSSLKFTLGNTRIGVKDLQNKIILPCSASEIKLLLDSTCFKIFTNDKGDSLFATVLLQGSQSVTQKTYAGSSGEILLSKITDLNKGYSDVSFSAKVYTSYHHPLEKWSRIATMSVDIVKTNDPGYYWQNKVHTAGTCPLCRGKNEIVTGTVTDTTRRTTKHVVQDGSTTYSTYNIGGYAVDRNGNIKQYTITDARNVPNYKLRENEIVTIHEHDKTEDCPFATVKIYKEYSGTMYTGTKETKKKSYEHELYILWNEKKGIYELSKEN